MTPGTRFCPAVTAAASSIARESQSIEVERGEAELVVDIDNPL